MSVETRRCQAGSIVSSQPRDKTQRPLDYKLAVKVCAWSTRVLKTRDTKKEVTTEISIRQLIHKALHLTTCSNKGLDKTSYWRVATYIELKYIILKLSSCFHLGITEHNSGTHRRIELRTASDRGTTCRRRDPSSSRSPRQRSSCRRRTAPCTGRPTAASRTTSTSRPHVRRARSTQC